WRRRGRGSGHRQVGQAGGLSRDPQLRPTRPGCDDLSGPRRRPGDRAARPPRPSLAALHRRGDRAALHDGYALIGLRSFRMSAMSIFREDLFLGWVALITGGGTGIGRGIAEALARHGADVAIVSRKQENLSAAAEPIVATTGRRCLPLVADVRQPAADI